MKTACKFLIALLVMSMFLMGCEKINKLTGRGQDDAKTVEACKTLTIGMTTSEMLGIMSDPMSKNKGMGDKTDLMNYVFTLSAVAVVVMVDIDSDEVVLIQCEQGYNRGEI